MYTYVRINVTQGDVTVPARTWLDGMDGEWQTPSATCGVPHLYSHGRLNITLSVKDGPGVSEMKFKGFISVLWGPRGLVLISLRLILATLLCMYWYHLSAVQITYIVIIMFVLEPGSYNHLKVRNMHNHKHKFVSRFMHL